MQDGTTDITDDPYAVVYPAFVKVSKSDTCDDFMELPSEKDGTLLLSTVNAQFPNATGLAYKSDSGGWRGIRIEDNIMNPPDGGWSDHVYYVTGSSKRKVDPCKEGNAKVRKHDPEKHLLSDLIVKSIPLEATEKDLSTYFSRTCGELTLCEVKLDRKTKKSRGFAFIRFKNAVDAKSAISGSHVILGKKVEVQKTVNRDLTLKLFVGRVAEGTTEDEMKAYFEQFGELCDVFIPRNFRGFGFVTYADASDGKLVLRKAHELKGSVLSVTVASPKDVQRSSTTPNPRYSINKGPEVPPVPKSNTNAEIVGLLATLLGKNR